MSKSLFIHRHMYDDINHFFFPLVENISPENWAHREIQGDESVATFKHSRLRSIADRKRLIALV